MSTLSQFFSGIKSIQRGQSSVNSATGTLNVTVSAVNTAKAVVNFLGTYAPSGAVVATADASLTNSTTLKFNLASVAGTGMFDVSWELVEYY